MKKDVKKVEMVAAYVIPHLENLRYFGTYIRNEVKTNQGRDVDLVVYTRQNEPLIAVEVKHIDKTWLENIKSEISHSSFVRELFLSAKELKTPYMLISNGEDHYWFTADRTGRPTMIAQPKEHIPSSAERLQASTNAYLSVAASVLENMTMDPALLPYILIEKIRSEKRHLEESEWKSFLSARFPDFTDKEMGEALDIFLVTNEAHMNDCPSLELLSSIDTNFLKNNSNNFMSRWLADFMVRLAQLQSSSKILDISAGAGNILAAAKMVQPELGSQATVGIEKNSQLAGWAALQQYILDQNPENIITEDIIFNPSSRQQNPTHIIFSPPFGVRVTGNPVNTKLFRLGVNNLEVIYLENSIKYLENSSGRIVVIVPEGLLFSKSHEYTRRYLLGKMKLRAIIGLDSGVWSISSHLKSSIIVLDTQTSSEPEDEVFMAQIVKSPNKDTFNALEIPEILDVINAFNSWTKNKIPIQNDMIWTTKYSSIQLLNFSTNFYKPVTERTSKASGFDEVKLRQIAISISRGRVLKPEESGNLSFIGVSAIRSLEIDKTAVQKTSEKYLQSRSLSINSGDVVLNSAGSHLGEAAVVSPDLDGMEVSQHVLIIKLNRDIVDARYLAIALNSEFVNSQIKRIATGTVTLSITKSGLENVLVPLPHLFIQRKIIEKVAKLQAELNKRKQAIQDLDHEFKQLVGNPFQAGGK